MGRSEETSRTTDGGPNKVLKHKVASPYSVILQALLHTNKDTFAREQENNVTLNMLRDTVNQGVPRRNVKLVVDKGIRYHSYKDRKGVCSTQIVVPMQVLHGTLSVCHGNYLPGRLGMTKTKQRLLQDIY